jgi:hypothetical protein
MDSTLTIKPDSTVSANLSKLDSIRSATEADYNTFKARHDSITQISDAAQTKLQSKIDSLTALNLPVVDLNDKLDSIKESRISKLQELEIKWDETRSRHTASIRELNLPPPWDQPQSNLLAATEKLDLNLPKTDFSLPSFSPDQPLGLDLPGIESPVRDIDLNKPEIPGLPSAELEQVKQYTDQVKAIKEGKVDDVIDNQLRGIEEISGLQEQQSQFEMPELDPNKAKQQYVSMARQAAKEHFAQKFDQVDDAMKKMSKLKQKYSSVQSVKDLPKRRPNEMRDKPFVERLVPAINLQLMQRNVWMLDVNPSVGYRFNPYFSAGLGWNQRWAYDFDNDKYAHDERMYGPRIYSEYSLKKAIAFRLETDYVNALVRTRFNDPVGREWVWNLLGGIKKDYRISKRLRGNLQLMYNFIDPKDKSPYPRLNVRIGFELGMGKGKQSKSVQL